MHKITSFWLTVNRACQLRCEWCYAWGAEFDTRDNLDLGLAIRLVDVMADAGGTSCKILGGEPSIYPEIEKIILALRQRNVKSTIISNGLAYADVARMERHFDLGLGSLIISIKAGSQEDYQALTKAAVYDKVLLSVSNLAGFSGGVSITITRPLLGKTGRAIRDVVAAGARFVNVDVASPVFIDGRPVGDLVPTAQEAAKEISELVPELEALGVNYNVQVDVPFCAFEGSVLEKLKGEGRMTSGCIVLKQSGLIFGTQGQVGFCNHLMDHPFGKYGSDFNTARELTELYLRQEEFFRVTNRLPSRTCATCEARHLCCGGCPLKWTCFNPTEQIFGGRKFSPEFLTPAAQ